MQKLFLVFVFALSLVVKVSAVMGAEISDPTLAINQLAQNDIDDSDLVTQAVVDEPVEEPVTAPQPNSTPIIRHAHHNTNIQNDIHVSGENLSANQSQAGAAATVLGVSANNYSSYGATTSITPMFGYTAYSGLWASHITNSGTFGLAIDMPVNSILSLEAEGSYGKFNTSYLSMGHDFNQYTLGGNAKLYFSRSRFQPYVGAGLEGVYYEGMYSNIQDPFSRYNQIIGAGKLLAGMDVGVAEKVAVGIRGAYVSPLLNRPVAITNGYNALPGYEDASAMDTAYYQVMATVKVSF